LNDPIRSLFREVACHTLGIAPINNVAHDFNKTLASLPPDEARAMKRKFRKLWRKFARESKNASAAYIRQLGLGEASPTKKQKKMRKVEVSRRIDGDVVGAMATASKDSSNRREGDT
jgi:hypothetical protein